MKEVALLVVDVQEVFLPAIPGFQDLITRTAFAIEAARLLDMQLIYTEQVPDKLGPTSKSLLDAGLSGGSKFTKQTFSAFGAEGLLDHLKKGGVQHLLIAGLETPICVYQTILSALKEGLDVTILTDCIASRREADHRSMLATLQNIQCQCLPSEAVFYSIVGTAEHPRFQRFTHLVKNFG